MVTHRTTISNPFRTQDNCLSVSLFVVFFSCVMVPMYMCGYIYMWVYVCMQRSESEVSLKCSSSGAAAMSLFKIGPLAGLVLAQQAKLTGQ